MNITDNGILRLILVLLLFSIPVALIEYLLCRLSRGKISKFILPIITLILGAGFIFYANTAQMEGFLDLAYVLIGIIFIGSFLSASVVLLACELMKRRNKKDMQ